MRRYRGLTSDNNRALAQAQQGNIYGRFVDVGNAFTQGLITATKGGTAPTTNPVFSVKSNYEADIQRYLDKMPQDMDLSAIPDTYKGEIQEFLMVQKGNYVELANSISDYEVGSPTYLEIQSEMNQVTNSIKNLKKQFDIYGANKKELLDDIDQNRTSLSIENQANVNLLKGVYTEQYLMNIDGFGNISFLGDDGERKLNDMPDYENKAFKIATNMEKVANDAYNNAFSKGIVINDGDANFNRDKKNLKTQIQNGGRNSLMSVIHDGIVGDTRMIDNPMIAENLKRYNEGSLTYEALTDLVVDTYMDAVIENSVQGKAAREKSADEKFYRSIREQKQSQKVASESKLGTNVGGGIIVKIEGDNLIEYDTYNRVKITSDRITGKEKSRVSLPPLTKE